MNKNQINSHSSQQNNIDEDFELMGDIPKEDPVITEQRRSRNDKISKKLGEYLLKGYCMLSEACPVCDCILLRTPDRELLCVGCDKNPEQIMDTKANILPVNATAAKKKKRNNDHISYSTQVENKLEWAVDKLTKSQDPDCIIAMCTVIIKLTETITILKEYEMTSQEN